MSDAKATSAIINTPSGTGLLGPISSLISQIQTDARNWATFGINTHYAKEDREFQREAYDYQKELNNLLMQREDNAIQRKAADLAAAGINPMLAGLAGGAQASAGTVINPGVNAAVTAGQGVNYLGEALDRLRAEKAGEEIKNRELDLEEYRNITDMKRQQNEERKTGIEKKLAEKELDLKEREFAQEQLRQYNELIERAKDRDLKAKEVEANIKTDNDRLEYDYWKAREDRLFEIAKTASLLEQEDKKIELQKEWQTIEKELNERELKIKKGVAISSEVRGYINTAESIWRSIENIIFPWTTFSKQADNKGNVTYQESTSKRSTR